MLQSEGMCESPVETLEKDLGLRHTLTGASHPLTPREALRVQCFKR